MRSAIVVGAGIGGLAAAVALQSLGWRVRVREKAAALAEVGAGLTVSPNAARALLHLGVYERVRPWLSLPPYQVSEDPVSGRETGRYVRGETTLERYGAPYAFVHRADLHRALADAVAAHDPQAVATGRACIGVEAAGPAPRVRYADGSAESADLVVGADGIRSAVRAALHGEAAPRYTGFTAWRGLLPLEAVPAAAVPAGSAIAWGVGRCFVRYRVEPRGVLNYVAFARQADWTEEGWTVPADPEVPARAFDAWHPALSACLRATPRERCFQWGLFDREPLPSYVRERVALLGDAAHPMLPFLGQGAALALEDAVVLQRVLAADADLEAALARYDAARRPRGTAAQLESRAAGERLHGAGADPATRNEETLDYFAYDAGTVAV